MDNSGECLDKCSHQSFKQEVFDVGEAVVLLQVAAQNTQLLADRNDSFSYFSRLSVVVASLQKGFQFLDVGESFVNLFGKSFVVSVNVGLFGTQA